MTRPTMKVLLGLCLVAAVVVPLETMAQAAATQDVHGVLPEGLDCSACHTPAGWNTVRSHPDFNHDRQTRFPLTGAHRVASCVGCHLHARFDEPKVAAADCGSCHADVHQGAMAAPCADCHTTVSFHDVEGLAVHARSGFPLTGAHALITCEACHGDDRGGAYAALDPDCASCHAADYQNATSIDHVALQLGTNCEDCHTTLAWGHAGPFDHATTGFALVGAHQTAPCEGCHVVPGLDPVFPGVGQDDCVGCHQADYDMVHGGAFPTDCTACHSVAAWQPAVFDHAGTSGGFTLVGAHTAIPCESCHTVPGFDLTVPNVGDADCVGCHQADYDAEHAGTGFPTDCVQCHTVDTWQGAVFDHDGPYFPIYSGKHNGIWGNDCTRCHDVANDFMQVTCLLCHEHRQVDMDDKHKDIADYAYTTADCLRCHPDGRVH